MAPSLKHPGFPQRKKNESNSAGHFASPGSFHPHPCHTRSARVFLSEYLGLVAKNSGVGSKANIFANLNSDVVFFSEKGDGLWPCLALKAGKRMSFGWLNCTRSEAYVLQFCRRKGLMRSLDLELFHGKRIKKGIGTCVITVDCKFK